MHISTLLCMPSVKCYCSTNNLGDGLILPHGLLDYPDSCCFTRLDRHDANVALVMLHQGQELVVCMQLSWDTRDLEAGDVPALKPS